MIGVALGLLALLQEQVENPEYKYWASFNGRSTVTRALVVDGKVQEGRMKVMLKYVGDKSVFVEESSNIPGVGPAQLTEREIPAKIDAASASKPDQKGEEDIIAGGKKLKCKWIEFTRSADGGAKEVVRLWLSELVPGKVAQSRVTYANGLVATLVATQWEKK